MVSATVKFTGALAHACIAWLLWVQAPGVCLCVRFVSACICVHVFLRLRAREAVRA